jgi:N-methylhydantoinase A
VPVYWRDELRAGHRLLGPAIIEQSDTTTPLLPGWGLTVDGFGNLHLARGQA